MELKVFVIVSLLAFAHGKLLKTSCKQIRQFVDSHNAMRAQVAGGTVPRQPGTPSMKMMVWDEELQKKAENWAAQNLNKHNPKKTIPSGRFKVGENLYWYSTTNSRFELDPVMAPEAWFNEHVNFTYGPLNQADFDGSRPYDIGHYTQMVWQDTVYLGCAISQVFSGPWNKFMVVCNYGPAGNWLGEVPYKRGTPSKKLTCDIKGGCNSPYGSKC